MHSMEKKEGQLSEESPHKMSQKNTLACCPLASRFYSMGTRLSLINSTSPHLAVCCVRTPSGIHYRYCLTMQNVLSYLIMRRYIQSPPSFLPFIMSQGDLYCLGGPLPPSLIAYLPCTITPKACLKKKKKNLPGLPLVSFTELKAASSDSQV